MVEVLSKGTGTKETHCHNCGSHLRYKPSEVFMVKRNFDYTGDYDLYDAIKCPACGEETTI